MSGPSTKLVPCTPRRSQNVPAARGSPGRMGIGCDFWIPKPHEWVTIYIYTYIHIIFYSIYVEFGKWHMGMTTIFYHIISLIVMFAFFWFWMWKLGYLAQRWPVPMAFGPSWNTRVSNLMYVTLEMMAIINHPHTGTCFLSKSLPLREALFNTVFDSQKRTQQSSGLRNFWGNTTLHTSGSESTINPVQEILAVASPGNRVPGPMAPCFLDVKTTPRRPLATKGAQVPLCTLGVLASFFFRRNTKQVRNFVNESNKHQEIVL